MSSSPVSYPTLLAENLSILTALNPIRAHPSEISRMILSQTKSEFDTLRLKFALPPSSCVFDEKAVKYMVKGITVSIIGLSVAIGSFFFAASPLLPIIAGIAIMLLGIMSFATGYKIYCHSHFTFKEYVPQDADLRFELDSRTKNVQIQALSFRGTNDQKCLEFGELVDADCKKLKIRPIKVEKDKKWPCGEKFSFMATSSESQVASFIVTALVKKINDHSYEAVVDPKIILFSELSQREIIKIKTEDHVREARKNPLLWNEILPQNIRNIVEKHLQKKDGPAIEEIIENDSQAGPSSQTV